MIVVLDYDAGNLTSMGWALKHVGAEVRVARSAAEADGAERIVFPGVGSAASCMEKLRERGFDRVLAEAYRNNIPTLAVCIGMQLLFETSDEDGGVPALGILPGAVRRFSLPSSTGAKIPHMGWNRVKRAAPHPLWGDGATADGEAFYFVHSYHAVPGWDTGGAVLSEPAATKMEHAPRVYGATEHGGCAFASAAGAGSFFAVQFHPERSGEAGLALLRRFARWEGAPCC